MMAKVAQVIENGVVVNGILVPDDAQIADDGGKLVWDGDELSAHEGSTFAFIEGAAIGWIEQDGEWTAPPEPEPPVAPAKRQFTFLEFMELFTTDEQLTLVEASMTLPPVKLWYDKALGAQYIDLDDPRTGPGLQALVDANLITSGRMAAVLAGQEPE
jgi:hypothetical protein